MKRVKTYEELRVGASATISRLEGIIRHLSVINSHTPGTSERRRISKAQKRINALRKQYNIRPLSKIERDNPNA